MQRIRLEAGCGPGQPEGLRLCGVALAVLARQHEVAGIGDQNQLVQPPVATHPVAAGGEPGVVAGRLDLHHTRLGSLALFQPAILQLLRTERSDGGMSWAAATVLRRLPARRAHSREPLAAAWNRDPRPDRTPRRSGVQPACRDRRAPCIVNTASPVSSKLKMGESSKMELTHPKVVASSAETLRRCVKHIAEGGRSERDLRDERSGLFDPGDCP